MRPVYLVLLTFGTIGVMYLASSLLYDPLLSVFVDDLDAFSWARRILGLVHGMLAGAFLMYLLPWRMRLLVILSFPVSVALVVPLYVYLNSTGYGLPSEMRYDMAFGAMLELLVYVLGVLVGALLVRLLLEGEVVELPPNTSLERTREG